MPIGEAKTVVNRAFLAFLASLYRGGTVQPNLSTAERAILHGWRLIKVLPVAARSALLHRQLLVMARAPREAYRRLRCEQDAMSDAMSISKLLHAGSPLRTDFLPIYEYVSHYPDGV